MSDTLETEIKISVNLDGTGKSNVETGVSFLEQMLDQVIKQGLIDIAAMMITPVQ